MMASVKQSIEQRDGVEGQGFGLWPASARVMQRLIAAASQWRVASGLGGLFWIGLDYAGAGVIFNGLGLDMTADDWRGLRLAEATVAAELNAARDGAPS